MTRALSLYLPTWPTDRLRRRLSGDVSRDVGGREGVILLVRPDHGREVVACCCEQAGQAGVHRGMTLAHARALLHGRAVQVEPAQPERDLVALHALARWANRVAPAVAVDPPDGLLMDVTGCDRLYRGEGRLAAGLCRAMSRFGLAVRLAIAPSYGAAWACARFAESTVTRLGDDDLLPALASLPVAALRLEPEVVTDLATVGVDRVDQLLALPRSQLVERFGETLPQRIDEALGRRVEAIEPVRMTPPPRVERVFDGPVKQTEAIEWTVRELVAQLSQRLQRMETGVRELKLRLDRVDVEPVVEMLRLGHPSRDAKHLWTLLRPRVERVNLGDGVEGVSLTAVSVGRLAQAQGALNPSQETVAFDASEAGRLVDLLTGRLGGARVLRPEPVDTHVPEKTWRWRPAVGEGHKAASKSPLPPPRGESLGERGAHATGWGEGRPPVLLESAKAIEVTLMRPDGPVLMLHRGESQRVLTTIGPERIALRWWRSTHPQQAVPERDYYKLQLDDGRWVWAFRESGTGRWFLQGMWS